MELLWVAFLWPFIKGLFVTAALGFIVGLMVYGLTELALSISWPRSKLIIAGLNVSIILIVILTLWWFGLYL